MSPTPTVYAALDLPAHTNGEPVLLAVLKHPDPTERKVIALSTNEATWLHSAGRLTGWVPTPTRINTEEKAR